MSPKNEEKNLILFKSTVFDSQEAQVSPEPNKAAEKMVSETLINGPLSNDSESEANDKLMASLPTKVYENCQRTARVILLAELEKMTHRSKKLKQELARELMEYLPQGCSNESGDYCNKTGYFKSIHYSRVRIGQRSFIQNILLNPLFKDKIGAIFQNQNYEGCDKARKNENSQVPFEVRKKVINCVISQFERKFTEHYKSNDRVTHQKDAIHEAASLIANSSQNQEEEQPAINQQLPNQEHLAIGYQYIFYLPIMPIPLHPIDYQCYQQSRLRMSLSN